MRKRSDFQQAIEERSVALQSNSQIFRRDLVPAVPLPLEGGTFIREPLGQLFHDFGNERVGPLNRAAGLIHEARLNVFPASVKLRRFLSGEEGIVALSSATLFSMRILGGACFV